MSLRATLVLVISVSFASQCLVDVRSRGDEPVAAAPVADPTEPARKRMVERHLVERGIKDPRVLDAFRTVPRHRFLPESTSRQAYDDESIPIGEGQTIV